jgi:hypothetical protein
VSQLNSADRGVVIPKAKPNVFTALLAIALVAIITGIVLLSMELGRYNWQTKPNPGELNVMLIRPAGMPHDVQGTFEPGEQLA